MRFDAATIKAIRYDIVKKTISLTFEVDANEQDTADELSNYANKDAGSVILEVNPRQLPLLPKKPRP